MNMTNHYFQFLADQYEPSSPKSKQVTKQTVHRSIILAINLRGVFVKFVPSNPEQAH
jgi:cytochrome oxidase Cu insertion factor (SCO1/SenC/PrrC family)